MSYFSPLLVAALIVFAFSCAFVALWSGHNKRVDELDKQTKKEISKKVIKEYK